MFNDLLKSTTNLGEQLLAKEIADHGKKEPASRPAEKQIVTQPEEPKMEKKTMYMIGGGIAVGVLALVLILKKK